MKDVQGYLALIPNNPSERGMLYFSLESAKQHKIQFDALVSDKMG